MKKVLFLYTELAGYFQAGIEELSKRDIDIHIVRWPVNIEAPFQFSFPDDVKIYERDEFDNAQLIKKADEISPDIIISSGWVDKGYLKVCRRYKNKIPVVLSMDNQWQGGIKQQIARMAAPFTLHKMFNRVWVPGGPQKDYALKLGFKEDSIKTGFYSVDVEHFSSIAGIRLKKQKIEKRFLFIGRYIPQKGIDKLFAAFIELYDEGFKDWELWCLGTGELFDQRPEHPAIKHFGFVQPSEMEKYLTDTGVFVLPSDFEPWGVVVHEMAAAAFPMVVSSAVGSVTEFVEYGKNGFVFPKGNKEELKNAMRKVIALSEDQLFEMAEHSRQKGTAWNTKKWADVCVGFIEDGGKVKGYKV